jgi:hypothetical protein
MQVVKGSVKGQDVLMTVIETPANATYDTPRPDPATPSDVNPKETDEKESQAQPNTFSHPLLQNEDVAADSQELRARVNDVEGTEIPTRGTIETEVSSTPDPRLTNLWRPTPRPFFLQ